MCYLIVSFVLDSVVAEICNKEVSLHYSKSLSIDEDDVPSQFTSKAVYSQFLRSSVMMDGVPSKVNVLLRKVSKSCVDFLIVLFMDCVQSWVTFFLWKVSNLVLISLLFFLWIVSNPGHGTRIARGWDWYTKWLA